MSEARIGEGASATGGPVVAFFDVDGTLVYRQPGMGSEPAPRPRVVQAVRAFAEASGIAVLSTGRAMSCVQEALSALPFRGYVTMDGAYVELDGSTVLDRCIPQDLLALMVEEMRRVGMSAFFQGAEACVELSPDGRNPYGEVASARTLEDMRRLKPDLRFGKVDFSGPDYERFRASDVLARELTYYDVGDGYHELVMPGVSKGHGARALLAALEARTGVPASRVYAFGDSENDVPLFEVADVAVAMGQASERVRAAADYVTDAAANDGVATALEHLGLI